MALFSRKTKETKETKPKAAPKTEAKAAAVSTPAMKNTFAHVLMNPRITEKATFASANSIYVFDVATTANKIQIAAAVNALYNVKPRMVRIVNIRPKTVRNARTGKYGMKSGGKKAYVYLPKGTTITIS
jgi:large subunit ribosomal protein L23